MHILNAAVGAALLLLLANPALAGDGPGGGGHRPHPYTPSPPHGGGYNSNINVNVNANANASANAFAGASGGGYLNARAYDVGSIRGGGYGGGTVYVGGGYSGGGHYGGGAIYNEEVYEGRTCASAPFGYVVSGFGRNGRRPPACIANSGGCTVDVHRGGRYGFSERHSCGGGRREADHGSHDRSRSFERIGSYERQEYREDSSWTGGHEGGPSHPCGCVHDGGHDAPYRPESPHYEPPAPPVRPHWSERPHPSQPPRRH